MAVYGKKLLDIEGNTILPKTRASVVYTSDDETVEKKISEIIDGTIQVGSASKALYICDAVDPSKTYIITVNGDDPNTLLLLKGDWSGERCYLIARDDTKMPLAGGTFTGWVSCNSGFTTNSATYFQGANNFGGTATFNNDMHLGGYCSMGVNKSPGNGFNAQPIHIPNISANINAVILWT